MYLIRIPIRVDYSISTVYSWEVKTPNSDIYEVIEYRVMWLLKILKIQAECLQFSLLTN